ncbi:unnamed protein product [Rotaria sp. Silwood2]|nr:unnamed protein product [Rotaria sp. Silwood2]
MHNFDPASQSILIQLCFVEFKPNIQFTGKVKEDFTAFCHETFKDDDNYPQYILQIEKFNANYNPKDAIRWGSGNCTEKSVILIMEIDRKVLQEKPIAFLGYSEVSDTPEECEIMLPMGIVFRVVSCSKPDKNDQHTLEIHLVRGEDEAKLEEQIHQYSRLIQISAGGLLLGTEIFSTLENNGQHFEKINQSAFHTSIVVDASTAEDLSVGINENGLSASTLNKATSSTTNVKVEMQENLVSKSNADIQNAQNNLPTTTMKLQAVENTINANNVASTAASVTSLPQSLMTFLKYFVMFSTIIAAVGIPLGAVLAPKVNSTTTACPHITCSGISSVQNPSPNYQVEHLDFNCSQTLSNMTIVQVVQRSFNETHAQQYQTFWNYSTNMTYIQTPTELIYKWFSLPGMDIVAASFPHFIEAQYFYTTGSSRITANDTWQIWLQSICGELLYLSGTF